MNQRHLMQDIKLSVAASTAICTVAKEKRTSWTAMIKRIAKERRDTRRALIKFNHQDSVEIAMTCWKILLNRKSISTMFFKREYFLRKWSLFCIGFTRFMRVSIEELEEDREKMRVKMEHRYNEAERKEQKNIIFMEKSYKACPLEWNRFRNSNWKVLSAMSVKDLSGLKYLFEFMFLMSKIYFDIVDGYSAPIFLENDDFYKNIVQRMYLERFRGVIVVNFDDFSLCCRYPVEKKKRQVPFFTDLHSIEHIIGFYNFVEGDIMHVIGPYLPAHKPVIESSEATDLIAALKIDFEARYINRFAIEYFFKDDVCVVVVKCRLVRKKDGKVSDQGKVHSCSLLEAMEKLRRGYFNRYVEYVIELEKRMKIEHSYGPLLEHWDGCF
jgi:hypothetical protein